MKKIPLLRSLAALSTCLMLLAGCGGGGGSAPASPRTFIQPTTPLGSSFQYEEAVAGCSVETQKKWVRSYLDEVYLWYDEIVDVDPSRYRTADEIPEYFDALLVRPKDRFSGVLPVADVKAATSASAAALQADPRELLADHTANVPQTRVVTTAGNRTVGYVDFRDHALGAQDDLITAFRQLKSAGVQDLVLDLRDNSGGYLYIAQTAASMITGPQNNGRIFEKLHYNDKRKTETNSSTLFFSDEVQFEDRSASGVTQYREGTVLPQLGLPRVFVLTTGATCSASESIINSLRGIDVEVVRIGTKTCGKPYGFQERDNCDLAFFPIEFKGTNAKGFGDYTAGFTPTCKIADRRARDVLPGDETRDPLMRGALYYIDNNACPSGTATGVQSAAVPHLDAPAASEQPSRPAWAGRLLLPQQQR